MNETIKLLTERGSCRHFTDKPIPSDVMDELLKSAICAPTGGNLQPYSIIKIEAKDTLTKLARLCRNQMFIADAPAGLLFCIDWNRLSRWADLETAPFTATKSFRHFWISFQDTIIAAQQVCTAADALGLGSVYIGTVLECFRELKQMFKLPTAVMPVVLLSVGYPKDKPAVANKLGADIIVHNEQYNEPSDEQLKTAFAEKYEHKQFSINDERLAKIKEVSTNAHGTKFADHLLETIQQNGYINIPQRYFGLHYRADRLPANNQDYIDIVTDFGFNWFEPITLPIPR